MQHPQLTQLLGQMTLDEKIGQLLQLSGDFYSDKAEDRTGPMNDLGLTQADIDNAGSILGVVGAAECRRIQTEHMERSRLHIPTVFMGDVIHGYRTIFPIPLGLASSWDAGVAEGMARVAARESSVSGLSVTFSPMVDLVRDPRWGRVMESTGEDPYLNGVLAAAMVRGYQGEDLRGDTTRVAACVKHFAAYGAAIAGRDYNTVDMSERLLRDMYLPGYREAIDAGAKLAMTSFNTVDGIPATGNKHLLREILRDEFDFRGVVISDFGAVKELIAHGVAENEEDAAQLALDAGVDIEMMTVCYLHALKSLIEQGKVAKGLLDAAVMRILELKNDLGLFEHPFRGMDETMEAGVVFCGEHRQAAGKAAAESIVLLANQNAILPMGRTTPVAIIGPGARSRDILGAWSWLGRTQEAVTLAEGVRALSDGALISTQDFDYLQPTDTAVNEALDLARQADIVVLALGEPSAMSGEAASRSDIRLPQAQIDLFDAVHRVNENIVVTLFNGRPLDLTAIKPAKAIVEAWFPGTEGGAALAAILFGVVNPSGKLAMSFPQSVGQVPIYYNADSTGRPYEANPGEQYVSKYLDISNRPAYPFGYGLSYSDFFYGPPSVSALTFGVARPLEISVEVTNRSEVQGAEIVQLYVHDLVGEVVRPVKQLKGFKRVTLGPGQCETITFTLTEADVRYAHGDGRFASDPGDFNIMVGRNSRDVAAPIRVRLA